MNTIATNLKNNSRDLIAIVSIQVMTAISCYLLIPRILS